MPFRLWVILAVLCGAIAMAAGFAIYAGAQEVRLHRSGPRRQLCAEQLDGQTRGLLLVLGCARHDLEVVVSEDGTVVGGERDSHDRVYFPLVPGAECGEDRAAGSLHVKALVEAQVGGQQGLARLYGQGYMAPPTSALVDGVIGYGVGDGRGEHVARRELSRRGLRLQGVPLLVKGKRPGPVGVAYATLAVGVHGALLLLFLLGMALRREFYRRRGIGIPEKLIDELQ